MSNPLDGYDAHAWSTYIINIQEGIYLPTRPLSKPLVSLKADSDMARKLAEAGDYDPAKVFFYDYEQLVMGHNVHGCSPVVELGGEYEGHPEGKLCFVSYEGMENDPPTYVFYVER